MRELQPWADESAVAAAFDDITSLAAGCRFPDCAHGAEPGCAVRAAVESGRLDPDRLENFQRLGRREEPGRLALQEKTVSGERSAGRLLSTSLSGERSARRSAESLALREEFESLALREEFESLALREEPESLALQEKTAPATFR